MTVLIKVNVDWSDLRKVQVTKEQIAEDLKDSVSHRLAIELPTINWGVETEVRM